MLRIAPNIKPGAISYIRRVSTKLLITEITRMAKSFCVIGLQREGGRIQSLRPVRSLAKSWTCFPHQRGDVVEFSLLIAPGQPPHVEDRVSTRDFRKRTAVSESDLVAYLRKAECTDCLRGLFDCPIYPNDSGRGAYALPGEARRSICGCQTQNLRLEFYASKLRATLVLGSGEVLRDLPVVDRDWLDFVDRALAAERGANRLSRLERFLSSQFHYKIVSCPDHFVRVGLTRPYRASGERCYLMLDTLFPLPKADWLEEF